MLNGTHSMLAYAGFLLGCKYVRDVMDNPELSALVHRHLKSAANALQPLPDVDYNDYAEALAQRFANPAIAHQTFQIAMDGTEKLPQRIFQPAIEALDTKKNVRPFAFVTAMWIRFCMRKCDDGTVYDLHDPRSEELIAAIDSARQNATAIFEAVHMLPRLIPKRLTSNTMWREAVEDVLSAALNESCQTAIQREATRYNQINDNGAKL